MTFSLTVRDATKWRRVSGLRAGLRHPHPPNGWRPTRAPVIPWLRYRRERTGPKISSRQNMRRSDPGKDRGHYIIPSSLPELFRNLPVQKTLPFLPSPFDILPNPLQDPLADHRSDPVIRIFRRPDRQSFGPLDKTFCQTIVDPPPTGCQGDPRGRKRQRVRSLSSKDTPGQAVRSTGKGSRLKKAVGRRSDCARTL